MQSRSLRLAVLATALCLSACSLSPTQKKWAGFAAGVLIVGAIAAHRDGSGEPALVQPACSRPEHSPTHACQ
jgi:hypothetical protein